jgi:hypothetical protein
MKRTGEVPAPGDADQEMPALPHWSGDWTPLRFRLCQGLPPPRSAGIGGGPSLDYPIPPFGAATEDGKAEGPGWAVVPHRCCLAPRSLVRGIPGARFVPLQGRNHLFLENEPAFGQFPGADGGFPGMLGR